MNVCVEILKKHIILKFKTIEKLYSEVLKICILSIKYIVWRS